MMRALLQRVTRAAVRVEGETVGEIGAGLVALVGVGAGDGDDEAAFLAQKTALLRIFADDEGKINRSLVESGGAALVVSQFTLYADARKGRRPSFVHAAPPEAAERLVDAYAAALRAQGVAVATGRFRAYMEVEIHNDGPVTIWLDTAELRRG
ncbi:MAG TPA: D-aminoacyl-tRNA deacylase [Thermomicrobiales bacterium]|nr:D-aminoacyl-tRNA deacylase [Thermomicrobiales bacterium]